MTSLNNLVWVPGGPESVPITLNTIAAAGFNTKNPIMHAVIDTIVRNTSPNATLKTNVGSVRCEVCQCEMSSDLVYQVHIAGAKHKRKMKAKEIFDALQAKESPDMCLTPSLSDPNAYRCDVCQVIMNSPHQLELHVAGSKHRKNLAKSSDTAAAPPTKKKKVESELKLFRCDVCSVVMNSQGQLDQHVESKKHLNKMKADPSSNQNSRNVNKRKRYDTNNFQYGGKLFSPPKVPNINPETY